MPRHRCARAWSLLAALFAMNAGAETRGYVDGPMGQMHYREAGQGPAVLLLHQTPWFSVQYSNVMPLLAAGGVRALAPDTPGYGFSPVPAGQPAFEQYADQLVALLDARGIERATVVGHHTGAGLALAFAQRHPRRVRCLVLHGVPLYTDAERAAKLAAVPPPAPLQADGSHLSQQFATVREKFMHGRGSLEGVQWSVLGAALAEDRELKAYRALFGWSGANAALRSVTAPTLLLSSSDDSLHKATQQARALRPDFAYAEFDAGGSHLIFDRPRAWVDVVLPFQQQHCKSP